MKPLGFLFFILFSDCVVSWNTTKGYTSVNEEDIGSRKSRLFTFHTLDDDVVVELDFAVPFIKIPVKKSMDMTKGAMANINLGALVLAGVMTFGAAVVVPGLLSVLSAKLVAPHSSLGTNSYLPYRKSDVSDMWRYLAILDNALMEINIDTTSCMQKALCSVVKNSQKNVSKGSGSSMDKIIDGVASNEWLQRFIYDTPFYSAMKHGLDDLDCGREYDKCALSKRTLNMMLKKFVKLINGDNGQFA